MDRKSIFLALFIFIIIAFSLFFTLEDNPIQPGPPVVDNQNRAEEELEDVNFTIYNNQQKHELKLESKKVENFKSEARMELRPVEAEVHSVDTGELLYTLSGDFGIYYSSEEYIELRGNVEINSDRYHIEAEELDYYLSRNYLEGRGSVKISGDNFFSEAGSFNSDLNLKDLKLSGGSAESKAGISFEDLIEE